MLLYIKPSHSSDLWVCTVNCLFCCHHGVYFSENKKCWKLVYEDGTYTCIQRGSQIMGTRLPRVTKFGMVAHNICRSPVWKLPHVTLLVPRIWRWCRGLWIAGLSNLSKWWIDGCFDASMLCTFLKTWKFGSFLCPHLTEKTPVTIYILKAPGQVFPCVSHCSPPRTLPKDV
jgi:hypothetical protein